MTLNDQNIYPKLPIETGEAFRLAEIKKVEGDFEKSLEYFSKRCLERRKKLNRLREIAGWLGTLSSAVTIGGGAIGASGIGIIPGGVIMAAGATLGIGSVVAIKREKNFVKKLMQAEKLETLAESSLLAIVDKVSKALADGRIDENEFSEILEEKKKFLNLQRQVMRESVVSKNVEEEASKKEKDLGQRGSPKRNSIQDVRQKLDKHLDELAKVKSP